MKPVYVVMKNNLIFYYKDENVRITDKPVNCRQRLLKEPSVLMKLSAMWENEMYLRYRKLILINLVHLN